MTPRQLTPAPPSYAYACTNYPPEMWFSEAHPASEAYREDTADAVAICGACTTRVTCLTRQMDVEAGMPARRRHGVYGGLRPDERAALDTTITVDTPDAPEPVECTYAGTLRGEAKHIERREPPCDRCAKYRATINSREERDNQVAALIAKGHTDYAIANLLGMSYWTVRCARRRREDTTSARAANRAERLTRITELRAAGASTMEMVTATGVSPSQVKRDVAAIAERASA